MKPTLATPDQARTLRNMVRSSVIGAGLRINIRTELKRGTMTKERASDRIRMLGRILRAARTPSLAPSAA